MTALHPIPEAPDRRNLASKFGWSSAASVLQMLAGIASVVVLTRLLSPADYGLYGIALIAIAVGEVLTGGVLSSPLEQKTSITRADINSAFWANIAVALACSAVTIPVAAFVAQAAGYDGMLPLIAAACGLMIITAAGIVPESLLRRQQAFRPLAQIGMAATLAGLAAGIALAAMGAGVWSLMGLEAVRRLVLVMCNFALSRWRPDGGLDLRSIRATLPFVWGMLAANALGRADRIAPQVAATAFFGPEGLGLLAIATRIADQIQAFVAQPIGSMALPVLSSAASDRTRFHALMTDAWRVIAISTFPMFAGFAAIAALIVPVAVGEPFAGAAAGCAFMVLAYQRVVASKVNIAAAQATGRALAASGSIAASFVVHVLLLIVLAPLGIWAIAFAGLLRGWLTWPFAAWVVKVTTGFPMARQMAILAPPLAASLIMGGLVYVLSTALTPAMPALFAAGLLVIMGAVVYACALWSLDPWAREAIINSRIQRFFVKGMAS